VLTFNVVKEKIKNIFNMLLRQRKVRRGSAAVLFLILIVLVITVDFFPEKNNLVVGQVSSKTIKAPESIVFEDTDKTNEKRRLAAEKVDLIYSKDPQVGIAVKEDIANLADQVCQVQEDESLDVAGKIAGLRSVLTFEMDAEDIQGLAQSAPADTREVEDLLKQMVAEVMETSDGVTQDHLEEVKNALIERVNLMRLSPPYEKFARGVVNQYLRPNSFVNYEQMRLEQEEAMSSVPPVMVSVKAEEKIIGEGEVVTQEHLAKLRVLGLTRPELPVASIIGSFLLVALLMLVVLLYLYQQNREIYEHSGHLYLLGIIVFMVLAVGKAIIAIDVTQWPEFGAQFGYMVPLAAAGMLIAILLDSRLAVLVVAVMSFMLGVMTGSELRFGLVGLIGGIAGVYSVSKLSQRGDLVRAGVFASLANVAAIFVVGLATGTSLGLLLPTSLSMGFINGIVSSILTNGTLPFFENTFRLTSPVRLLELSQPNNVLLKKLLTEAPGTYHHSIIVGNLAEAAVDAVGGDSLLVRVGAYYHDIGKIKRPYFFIENQMSCENPHDKIAPSLSTLILTSHVKDGVEMAREHKLPQVIIDIIEQHHGNGLVKYFFHKALENDRTGSVTEEEYRYEGPKPQTRESAIVMLADSVEAAVRSMKNRSPGRLEGLVRKIIKDKLYDEQLEECDLTFKDLDVIASAFVKVLSGIFHSRVEYPDWAKEIERSSKNGGSRKQLTGRSGGR